MSTNITRREWRDLLVSALSDCGVENEVTHDTGWLKSRLGTTTISINLRTAPQDYTALIPIPVVSSSSSLPSNLLEASAHAEDARDVLRWARIINARLCGYTVWIQDCPCDWCSGRGHDGPGNPCRRCGGKGVRNDENNTIERES